MWPHPVRILGSEIAIWNVLFLVGVGVGYLVLRWTFAHGDPALRPSWLGVRFLLTVYVAALGAQMFAYLFDLHTSLLPPPGASPARYYLDPLYGPKTLYGAVLVLPIAMIHERWIGDYARSSVALLAALRDDLES